MEPVEKAGEPGSEVVGRVGSPARTLVVEAIALLQLVVGAMFAYEQRCRSASFLDDVKRR